MNSLFYDSCPQLLLAAAGRNSSFPDGDNGWLLNSWSLSGDWHEMTIDSNLDKSTGLDGDIAVDCLGSWEGGSISKTLSLSSFAEISFDHYVQNALPDDLLELNALSFLIDNSIKLQVSGPSPWQSAQPIGIPPGSHSITFHYNFIGSPTGKKAVIDNLRIREAAPVPCIISDYSPPKPAKSLAKTNLLRGFSRFQEMTAADTEIKFTAIFSADNFLSFLKFSDHVFYFVDEFNICYRGVFPNVISPKSIALKSFYSVDLVLVANQKAGVGLCRLGSV